MKILMKPLIIIMQCVILTCGFMLETFAEDDVQNSVPPMHIQNELPQFHFSGKGTQRWFGFKIYDARLWVSDKGYLPSAPSASKFVLDIHYARHFDAASIAQRCEEEMEELGLGNPEKRADWQKQLENIFPDVEDGTHLTGVFLPETGMRFYEDGKLLGDINDIEFAVAFFAIWLDPKTSEPNLRENLLLNAQPD